MPKLTQTYVTTLKPGTHDRFEWDTELKGFGVRIWPSGRKSWVFKFSMGGKAARVTLGDMPALTAEAARKIAAEHRVAVHRGESPQLERRARRERAAKEASTPMMTGLFDKYLEVVRSKKKASTAAEYERLIGMPLSKKKGEKNSPRPGELRQRLGHLPVADVDHGHISDLHLSMADRPILANRSRAILSGVFRYAEALKWRAAHSNPCRFVEEYPEQEIERYLTEEEYGRLGDALRRAETEGLPLPPDLLKRRATEATAKHRAKSTVGRLAPANPISVAALRMLVLTGWRMGEVLGLRWEDLHPERSQALLPSSKTGKSRRDLGAPVWALLGDVARTTGSGAGYVFPGSRPGTSFTGIKRLWLSVRHAADLSDVRLHTLRHAAASVGATEGMTLSMIGKLLGHRDLKSTARYAHLTTSAKRVAADTLSTKIEQALEKPLQGSKTSSRDDVATVLPFKRRVRSRKSS